jgi:anthranilate phosphoribosyltransferase
MQEGSLKSFGGKIAALINGQDLSREEARKMFSQVLLSEQPDLQQGAFLAALTAKEETASEIAGAWEAIYELDTAKASPVVDGPLVDNCGTGMDTFKTFNISTAASVIAAAGGVYMAKHGARALTSSCGAVDIVETVGVDVECEPAVVSSSIEKAGIGLFNGMSPKVHPQALGRILSQIRFGTTLNIAGSLANPALPKYGARGVYSKELVEPVTRVMREIGYEKAVVFYGSNGNGKGMDEISTLGDTFVAELGENGEIETSVVSPPDFGIQRPDEQDIRPAASLQEEGLNLIKILSGSDKGARYNIVCLNTAPILYLTGRAKDLKEGFNMARDILDSGRALDKLRDWVTAQNTDPRGGMAKLETLLAAC